MSPIFRCIYHFHFIAGKTLRWFYRTFYAGPLFRSRCEVAGKGFALMKIPDVSGHSQIVIGNNVKLCGHLGVGSGRIFDEPKLSFGDDVEVGHDLLIAVNQEVAFGAGVRIGTGCRFMDTDGHPRDASLRAANIPPSREEIKPVRVGRNAAIGRGSFVLKGVTIGEGATIGVNSVVIASVPAYTVAAGNPARNVKRNTPPPSEPVGQ